MRHWPLIGRESELSRLRAIVGVSAAAGVVIAGEAGIGKSRLAAELASILQGEGRSVGWVSASQATAPIPFGAFAPLLESTAGGGETEAVLHGRLLDELRRRGTDDAPLVLIVDDASDLDIHSVRLVDLVCRHRVAAVVMTQRAGETRAPLSSLWKDGVIDRIDLAPLGRRAAGHLAEALLEGPVQAATLHDLWRRSAGNALYLRELVLGGLETRAFAREGGLWRAIGPLPPSARLAELVRSRLGRLDPDRQLAVETLAVGGPIDLRLLERIAGAAALEALEEARILNVEQTGNRSLARLAHPIYGEVLRAGLARTRARRLTAALADHLEASGARRGEDLLRLALWRLDSGGSVEPSLLLAAAAQALGSFDAPLAERMARASLGSKSSAAAHLLLGRALSAQQRIEEAELSLALASEAAVADDEIAQAALAHAGLLYFRAGRTAEATEILQRALGAVADERWRDELEALLVLFRAGAGELPSVAEAGRRIAHKPHARPRAVVHTLVYSSIANVMLGRFAEAEQQVEAGLRLAPSVQSDLPLGGAMLAINRVMALAYAGQLKQAVDLGREGERAALESGAVELAAMWSMNLSECLLLSGMIEGSLHTMLGALAAVRVSDPFAVRGIDAAVASLCASWLGRAELASELHREIVENSLAVDVRSRIWMDRAAAWLLVADVGRGDVARRLVDRARAAAADTHLVWAAWLLHDAVRLGHPELASPRLTTLADRIEGEMVVTMAEHAEALGNRDAVKLERVASSFEQMGSVLFAAEAAAQAQHAYLRRGREQLARIAGARASLLSSTLGGVRTPALLDATPVRLTRRELEIARLAAAGLSSRDLADRLEISVRTVDNHLGAIYGKLGVAGRADLPAVLGIGLEDRRLGSVTGPVNRPE